MKTVFFISLACMSSIFAQEVCDETQPHRSGVKLFYTSEDESYDPLDNPPDYRDDVERPGNNESNFYDYLTH